MHDLRISNHVNHIGQSFSWNITILECRWVIMINLGIDKGEKWSAWWFIIGISLVTLAFSKKERECVEIELNTSSSINNL